MTRDEHQQIIQQILPLVSADNQASASDLLTRLSEDYNETITLYEGACDNLNKVTENNEKLREVNAKLFLKVGETEKKEENAIEKMAENKPEFADLFDEKGELK